MKNGEEGILLRVSGRLLRQDQAPADTPSGHPTVMGVIAWRSRWTRWDGEPAQEDFVLGFKLRGEPALLFARRSIALHTRLRLWGRLHLSPLESQKAAWNPRHVHLEAGGFELVEPGREEPRGPERSAEDILAEFTDIPTRRSPNADPRT